MSKREQLLCILALGVAAVGVCLPVLSDGSAVFNFNDGNIESVLSPIYEYPQALFRVWDNQFYFGRGESFGVGVSEWSLLETLLGPHHYRRWGVVFAIWFTGLAGLTAARMFGRSWPASFLAGCFFLLCGWTVTFPAVGLLGRSFSLAWAALAFGWIHRGQTSGEQQHTSSSLLQYGLAGAALGFGIDNTPDVGALFAIVAALFLVATHLSAGLTLVRTRTLAIAGAVLVLTSLFAAWPTVVKMRSSQYLGSDAAAAESPQQHFDWATQWSLPPSETWSLVSGNFFGSQTGANDSPYWGRLGQSPRFSQTGQGYPNFKLSSYTLGAVALVLFAFQLSLVLQLGIRRDAVIGGLATLCLFLAWGRYVPGYRWLSELPLLSSIRNPEKWLGPLTLLVGLGAAAGFDRLRSLHRKPQFSLRFEGLAWTLALLGVLFAESLGGPRLLKAIQELRISADPTVALKSVLLGSLVVVLGMIAIAVATRCLARSSAPISGKLLTSTVLLALVLELWIATVPYVRKHSYQHVTQPNLLTETLDQLTTQGRIKLLPARHPVLNNWRLTYLISRGYDLFDPVSVSRLPAEDRVLLSTFGQNELDLWRWGAVRFVLCPVSLARNLTAGPDSAFRLIATHPPETWDPHLGAAYRGRSEDISLLEFTDAMPPYRLATRFQLAPAGDQGEQLGLIAARNRTRPAVHAPFPVRLVEAASSAEFSDDNQSPDLVSASLPPIERLIHDPTHEEVRLTIREPALLTRAARYAKGWEVTVNGEPTELLRVDHSFQGVFLEPGIAQIEFRFRQPPWVFYGGVLSRVTFLLFLVIAVPKGYLTPPRTAAT